MSYIVLLYVSSPTGGAVGQLGTLLNRPQALRLEICPAGAPRWKSPRSSCAHTGTEPRPAESSTPPDSPEDLLISVEPADGVGGPLALGKDLDSHELVQTARIEKKIVEGLINAQTPAILVAGCGVGAPSLYEGVVVDELGVDDNRITHAEHHPTARNYA
eukprot:CAMPEP_0173288282 /NCGR_PEP_ID=MMETSP1143-20121109/10320_1 /TAXON_ID=483371 /ORGANISM="non described non described, Strain CCMP2298" /LENGTH=159 /DNA_ID=CAMNT_0014227009 /DNA_START=131 /DNA_END=611 /DNA_ORIENTATION=-